MEKTVAPSRFTLGMIQMDTINDKERNLAKLRAFIKEASEKGVKLVTMPEMVNFIGRGFRNQAETLTGETFQMLSWAAKTYKLWIHGGSIYEINPKNPQKPFNTTMLINPLGELVATYRKIHPFDMRLKEGILFRESGHITLGDEIVTYDTGEVGHLGLSICYDLLFSEPYRIMMERGAQLFFVPAHFVFESHGGGHWQALLQARAIENSSYFIAPAQFKPHSTLESRGRSLMVSPRGEVIATAPDSPALITAEIDLTYIDSIRNQALMLKNRRTDLYEVKQIRHKN